MSQTFDGQGELTTYKLWFEWKLQDTLIRQIVIFIFVWTIYFDNVGFLLMTLKIEISMSLARMITRIKSKVMKKIRWKLCCNIFKTLPKRYDFTHSEPCMLVTSDLFVCYVCLCLSAISTSMSHLNADAIFQHKNPVSNRLIAELLF